VPVARVPDVAELVEHDAEEIPRLETDAKIDVHERARTREPVGIGTRTEGKPRHLVLR
jgi:hypothetical protein